MRDAAAPPSGSTLIDLPPSPSVVDVTLAGSWNGPALTQKQRVSLYSSDDWEEFIYEWARELDQQYYGVKRLTGAGDKGIDIAAVLSERGIEGDWHCFQCKHYGASIGTAAAFPEIAKILNGVRRAFFVVPTKYRFVAPRGCSASLGRLLLAPAQLKRGFIAKLKESVANLHLGDEEIKELKSLAEATDFSIFGSEELSDVLDVHKASPQHVVRFGSPLPVRPADWNPPETPAAHEARYIQQLIDVYREAYGEAIDTPESAALSVSAGSHYRRQREAFYSAEALRTFARDCVPSGTFESLKQEIFDGVVETCDMEFPSGLDRLTQVLLASSSLDLGSNILIQVTRQRDRKGVCHQLANEDQLRWCPERRGVTP